MDQKALVIGKNSKYLAVRNFILLVILLIFIIICLYIQRDDNQNSDIILSNTSCNSGNGCTYDFLIDNQTCQSYNKKNGDVCDNDICFNHSLCTPTCNICNNGACLNTGPECIGPRDCCLGLCEVDSDCANKITFLTQSFDYQCLYDINGTNGSCSYYIYHTMTNNVETCLGLIDGPISKCMHATTSDTFIVGGYCFFSFKCAPPLTALAPEL